MAQMTTTCQDNGEVMGDEPLQTLAKFRSGAKLNWHPEKWSADVFFGWNVVANNRNWEYIRVGDYLHVTSRRGVFHAG